MKLNSVKNMKNLKKLIFVSIFSILLIGSFLVPKTIAQEWTYDDIDTTNIPGFSVYPSEWYIYNGSSLGDPEYVAIEYNFRSEDTTSI